MPFVSEQGPSSKGRNSRILSTSSNPTGRHSFTDKDTNSPKFPRIEDCAHFHYETVDYGRIKVSFVEESPDGLKINGSLSLEGFNPTFCVRISCKDNIWVVRRSLSHFETLDIGLHECVFDRRFSHLPVLKEKDLSTKTLHEIERKLQVYLGNLTNLTDVDASGGQIFCAPILHWFEIDNHGHNLAPHALGDVADINIPAVAAARVVRRYQARDDDELNLNVGDMVSIIEMGATGWWRGKQGLKVGSFPAQCVRRINSATDVVGTHERPFSPPTYGGQPQDKPIVKKHGKFMDFLRSFLDTRPTKSHLKKKGILRERVFGCDLGELLHRTNEDVPTVVSDCTRFVERRGIVDGIYRISGVASHIRHLRYEFDSDRRPDLEKNMGLPKLGNVPGMSRDGSGACDPHSVAGLCKLYFRELPNPLLTYQLYNRFASAVSDYEAEERLLKVHDVIQQLPPPHYRTLKHLINHLRFMAQREGQTSMHCRNLAIVWAPNLLRSREIEAGLAAFTEARVQSVVTEFLIVNGDLLFSEKLQTMQYDAEHKPPRPRSLMVLPTPKLISLEEAQARSKSGIVTPVSSDTTSISSVTSTTGVRMRQSAEVGRSSSNERRKRSKKRASASSTYGSNSPHPVARSSKKQGHRHAASYSEPSRATSKPQEAWTEESITTKLNASSTSQGSGWKVKLGSLLKKPAQQNQQLSRRASLRRTQSDDSLVSSHSAQRKRSNTDRDMEFRRPSLGHAVSCEETNISDRSRPQPQTPHPSHSSPSSSPVRLREKTNSPHHKASSRPAGGVYSEFDVQTPDDHSFHITFRKVNSRKASKETLSLLSPGETNIRSSSPNPFSGLSSDFPSVMGEDGLDFDPLSFRPAHLYSPVKQGPCTKFPHHGIFDEETNEEDNPDDLLNVVKSDESPRLDSNSSSPRPFPNVTVTVKRVASIQSLHGESMFAAVSSITPHSLREDSTSHDRSSKKKKHSPDFSRGENVSSQFDCLTADTVFSPYASNEAMTSSTKSAMARLRSSGASDTFKTGALVVNESFNNNKADAVKREDCYVRRLDALTADCLKEDPTAQPSVTPRRTSAAEKLGLTGKSKAFPFKDSVDDSHLSNNKPDTTNRKSRSNVNQEISPNCSDSEVVASAQENCHQVEQSFNSINQTLLEKEYGNTEYTVTNERNALADETRQISVQVFDNPDSPALSKDSHYGSFIALVGSNLNVHEATNIKQTNAGLQTSSSRSHSTVGTSLSDPYTDNSRECKTSRSLHRYDLSRSVTEKQIQHRDSRHSNRSRQRVSHEQQKSMRIEPCQYDDVFSRNLHETLGDHARVGRRSTVSSVTPRLDTFNPEGKQKKDYKPGYVSPRYEQGSVFHYDRQSANVVHERSQSDDTQLYGDTSHRYYPSQFSETIDERHQLPVSKPPRHKPRYSEIQQQNNLLPHPAPRLHFRSYSAGDDLEPSCINLPPPSLGKPKPAPRSSYSPPKPAPRFHKPMRRSTGDSDGHFVGSFDNRTYVGLQRNHELLYEQYPQEPLRRPQQYFREQSLEHSDNVSYSARWRHEQEWPKHPNHSRASYAGGTTYNRHAGMSYNNSIYESDQPYFDKHNAPIHFSRNEPYVDTSRRRNSVSKLPQTSSRALSWV